MARTHTLLQLLLHRDPVIRQQGHALLAALPELADELCGPGGTLWDGTIEGVLTGLELLLQLSLPDGPGLWNGALDCMADAGPLSWQKPEQHRRDLHDLRQWAPDTLPPLMLRDICRRGLWMLRRHSGSFEVESLWARAYERFHDLQAMLSTIEFYTDTLDDEPELDEIEALQTELQAIGERMRQPLAELLILVHLLRAEAQGAQVQASAWHRRYLSPLLLARLSPR